MITMTCDRCGKTGMTMFSISIHEASNPYPSHYDDASHGVGVHSSVHKTFMVCGKCYKKFGLPNIYKDNERFEKDLKKQE